MVSRSLVPREREVLEQQPKTVLLQIAVELDPEAVAEAYEEDWTKEDLISFIEDNVNRVLGSRVIEDFGDAGDLPSEEVQEEY